MSIPLLDNNIFKNTRFRISLLYILIISAITLIFNFVILGTVNVNNTEINEIPPDNSIYNEDLKRNIVNARNQKAGEQIGFSLLWLDAFILTAGGFGSYWLAKKTLEPLERAHEMQSQFVSDISHELKTPLATIQLESEILLRDKSAKKDDMKEVIESNLEEAKSLTSLTQMLLKLSQMDDSIKNSSINLNEIVEARVSKFSKESNINFEATKTFLVLANETALDEIVTILIDNALKYRIGENPIEVKISREHRQAVVEVTNDSDEISKEDLDKLFDRFYRQNKARTRNNAVGGHGLGLSIARKLVELMDASLSVRNEKFIIEDKVRYKTTFKVGFHFSK